MRVTKVGSKKLKDVKDLLELKCEDEVTLKMYYNDFTLLNCLFRALDEEMINKISKKINLTSHNLNVCDRDSIEDRAELIGKLHKLKEEIEHAYFYTNAKVTIW